MHCPGEQYIITPGRVEHTLITVDSRLVPRYYKSLTLLSQTNLTNQRGGLPHSITPVRDSHFYVFDARYIMLTKENLRINRKQILSLLKQRLRVPEAQDWPTARCPPTQTSELHLRHRSDSAAAAAAAGSSSSASQSSVSTRTSRLSRTRGCSQVVFSRAPNRAIYHDTTSSWTTATISTVRRRILLTSSINHQLNFFQVINE